MANLIVEGPDGERVWGWLNIGLSVVYSLGGAIAYCLGLFFFGIIDGETTFYLTVGIFVVVFVCTMINFWRYKSAVFVSYLHIFFALISVPSLILSSSLAYYVGFSDVRIILFSTAALVFNLWSQSEEVKHTNMQNYIEKGIEQHYFRHPSDNKMIYDMSHREFVMQYFKTIKYPQQGLAKLIRGAALVLCAIAIPFGQMEAFANPTRNFTYAPYIVMIIAYLLFVMIPHQFSSSMMLIKLNGALKRGEIELSKFKLPSNS